jgi:hypothetical protein
MRAVLKPSQARIKIADQAGKIQRQSALAQELGSRG